MSDTTPTITARSGVLLVVCAPSGTGKTTLIQRLRAEFPNFAYSISCTTRAPRGHETDGKDYHFLSVEEFLRRREAGFFAEWANVHGNYYGTPLAPVLETLNVDVEQDVLPGFQGFEHGCQRRPVIIAVHVVPFRKKSGFPAAEELFDR